MTETKTRAPRAPKAAPGETGDPQVHAQEQEARALLSLPPRLVPAGYQPAPGEVVLPGPHDMGGALRVMTDAEYGARLAHLVAPFPQEQLERLPKQVRRDDNQKGKCDGSRAWSVDGFACGGYHAQAVHLTYVGHAGITMRLLQVDPLYELRPVEQLNGVPVANPEGSWWSLTVLGMTRLGYGDAQGKRGANAVKEVIGDALRNAALRFGVATYLWSKSEDAQLLAAGGELDEGPRVQRSQPQRQAQRPAEAPADPVHEPPALATTMGYYALVMRTVEDSDRGADRDNQLRALRDSIAAENPGALDVFVPVPAAWSRNPDEPGEAKLLDVLLAARRVARPQAAPAVNPDDDPWATPIPADAGSYTEGTR